MMYSPKYLIRYRDEVIRIDELCAVDDSGNASSFDIKTRGLKPRIVMIGPYTSTGFLPTESLGYILRRLSTTYFGYRIYAKKAALT